MFSNKMTTREKMLARLAGLIVPLMLLFWGGMWFSSRYFSGRATIQRLRHQIAEEENKRREALLAQKRRFFYRDRSGPADRNQLQVEYTKWLTDALSKRAGMTVPGIVPQPQPTPGTYRGRRTNVVYQQYTFTANRVIGDIGQLLTFLKEFEELDLLHRISTLKIQPQITGGSGGQPQMRTGKLVIDMTIEVIALVDADQQRDFLAVKRELSSEVNEWTKQIAARNIFGLANNPPSLSARNLRFKAERPAANGGTATEVATEPPAKANISLLIDGEDIDEHDVLNWEIVASDFTDYEFTPEGRRRARFVVKDIPVGSYALSVRVTDNGFPQKSAERTFNVIVEPPDPPREVQKPPPPPPPFRYAQTAFVIGSYEVDGQIKCIIEIKPLQKELHLALGESFELDKKTWTVRGIESREVVIQVGDELLTFKVGRTLDQPDFRYRIRSGNDTTTHTGRDGSDSNQDNEADSADGKCAGKRGTGDDDQKQGDAQEDDRDRAMTNKNFSLDDRGGFGQGGEASAHEGTKRGHG